MATPEAPAAFDALFNAVVSKWDVVAAGVIPLLALAIAYWRTGSSHILIARLWHIVLGPRALESKSINSYFTDRDDLMYFRMVAGIKRVSSTHVASHLIQWSQIHRVDLDLIRSCGSFFEAENIDPHEPAKFIKPPTAPRRNWTIIGSLACALLAIAIVVAGSELPAQIKVVKSGAWYSTSGDTVRRIEWLGLTDTQELTVSDCSDEAEATKRTKYRPNDIEALCRLMLTSSGHDFVRSAKATQFVLAFSIYVVLTLAAMFLMKLVASGEKASKLLRDVDARRRAT